MMPDKHISNYEQMKQSMADEFLKYDQDMMIQKFALKHDNMYLYIYFAGREYRINRLTGKVNWTEDSLFAEESADYNETMTIYDVLSHSQNTCCCAGEWINIDSLSPIQSGFLKKGSGLFQGYENYFDGKSASLSYACEALHGRKASKGDVAYEIDLFTFLPILLRFWESDEEFPASLQILADKNVLDYMHYETLMFAVTHVLTMLKSRMMSWEQGLMSPLRRVGQKDTGKF